MKRPLVLLLALTALVVAVIFLWPSEEAPPITEPEPTGPATEQESVRGPADIDAETERLREFAASVGGDTESDGPLRAELIETGEASLRAVDAAGEPVSPALFLLRGSGGQIEWIESASGELRFADLSGVSAAAALAQGHWSSPTAIDFDAGEKVLKSVDVAVTQAAAVLELRIELAGVGPADAAHCLYSFRHNRPAQTFDDIFNPSEEIEEVEASVDGSGIGIDNGLFWDAFRVSDPADARSRAEAGVLVLRDLPPSHYELVCFSPTGVAQTDWVTLEAGQMLQHTVELIEGGFVVGSVRGPEGVVLNDARVGSIALTAAFAELVGERQLLERLTRGTPDGRELAGIDEEGRYRMGPMAPGKVLIMGVAEGMLPARAGEVEVRAGLEVEAPEIQLQAGHALAALVRDAATGEVLEEAEVRWKLSDESIFSFAQRWSESEERDEAGRHILRNLPFQPIEIEARAEGFAASVQQYFMPASNWTAPEELPEFEFRLEVGRELHGTVLDPDGLPVAGAEVRLGPADEALNPAGLFGLTSDATSQQSTDEQGRFHFQHLAAGSYIAQAQDDTHAPGQSEEIDLTEALQAEVQVQLQPAGSLLVRYIGDDGQPEAGQLVIVTHLALLQPQQMTTDERGEARFDRLAAGDYNAQSIAAGASVDSIAEGEFSLGLTYFRLIAGEEKEIEIGPGLADANLAGRLTENGNPVENISVTVLGGGQIKATRTDENGEYLLENLVPQEYTFFAGTGQANSHAVEVPVESGDNRFDYELPGGGIEIRVVRDSDGEPVPGTPVTATSEDSLGNPIFTMTDSEGRAKLRFLNPGPYHVSAGTASLPLFPGDASLGSRSRKIQVGETSQTIEMRLEEGATFRVRVLGLNNQPLSGASMFYLREDGHPISALSMKATNSKGVAQLENLPSGPGRILIKHPTGGQKEFAINLTAGELSKQEVRLDEGVTVWLRVLDASGQPASGVMATLKDDRGVRITMMWSMEETQQVNQAYFAGMEQRLGPVAPGRYTVEIFRLGGEIVTEELTVPAGSPEFRRTLVYRP